MKLILSLLFYVRPISSTYLRNIINNTNKNIINESSSFNNGTYEDFSVQIQSQLPINLQTPNNKGWADYLVDRPSASVNVPLTWVNNTKIPTWIKGSYIKNGPGRKSFEQNQFYVSYKDGWGKLHKLTFSNGTVTYSGKMIMTENYNKSLDMGRLVPTVTLNTTQPKQWNNLELQDVIDNGQDNTNINIWRIGSEKKPQYIAVSNFPTINEIDLEALEVLKTTKLENKGNFVSSSSHWRREIGLNSSLHFQIFLNDKNGGYNFTLFRHNNSFEDAKIVGSFHLQFNPLIHMISTTADFVVIVVCPLTINLSSMDMDGKYPVQSVRLLKETTKIYLMNLKDGSVGPPFEVKDPSLTFVTHHVNVWEESQYLVVDLVTQPWDSDKYFLKLDTMLNHVETHDDKGDCLVKRVRLNLSTRELHVEDWPNKRNIPMLNTIDYPTINPAFQGVKNRYVYGWVSIDYWRQVLVKKDLEDSVKDKRWFTLSHYPGELIFIGRPGAKDEDDGVLVTIVFDGDNTQSYLLLLDGQTFKEINRAYLPDIVPYGFHGNWFPELM